MSILMDGKKGRKTMSKRQWMGLAAAACVALSGMTAWGAVELVNGVEWTYTDMGDTVALGGGIGNPALAWYYYGDAVIPATLGGKPVTALLDGAFGNCYLISSVSMPSTVTNIRQSVFYKCTGLQSVRIGRGVKNISTWAFYGCTGLTQLTIPAGVENIDWYAFEGCTGLRSVEIPQYVCDTGLGTIFGSAEGKSACQSITNVMIADGVTNFTSYTFYGCSAVKTVEVPDSVTKVGNSTFGQTPGLATLIVPASWKGTDMLKNAAVPSGCKIIYRAAPTLETVWRFYSKNYKGHFFTIDGAEKDGLIAGNPNWKFEGGAYRAYTGRVTGTVALHRFYSKSYRGHFFTIDEEEMETVRDTNPNWKYEGVAYHVYPEEEEGSVPVYRFWSKGYRHHFYTTSRQERDSLIAGNPNWKYEGVAFWAMPKEDGGTETYDFFAKSLAKGKKVELTVALDERGIETQKDNGGNTTARIGVWVPSDFNPSKTWKVLLISATDYASSVGHMDGYLEAAKAVGGWIVMAADGVTRPDSAGTSGVYEGDTYRWAVMRAGLQILAAQWPAARQWPVAAGGFSGGAKRTAYMAGLLMANGYPLIGMWMGGCNEDRATDAWAWCSPGDGFFDVPIFLSGGNSDTIATPAQVQAVYNSMQNSGFSSVQMKMFNGGHSIYRAHVEEGLRWFANVHAGKAKALAGKAAGEGGSAAGSVSARAGRSRSRGVAGGGVAVTTSNGSDGSAVADGDEGTAWAVDATGGAWVALSFEEPVDVAAVEVAGENLPGGMRVLASEDADEWTEGTPMAARYVLVAFPDGAGEVVVREITLVRGTP